jgi:hypothetical protein
MVDEIPSINDLLDIYENDPDWSELQNIYNELTNIVYKCLIELHPFLIQDTKFLPDDRHYILLYLFRSKRIFNSILLLLIYKSYAEAKMLQRAFFENIVDTKIFMRVGSRARNKRKIKLYCLLNEKRRYDLYIEDYNDSKKKYGKIITSVTIAKMNEKLRNEINEKLKHFKTSELSEMQVKLEKGKSWHGLNTKGAFKICKMKHLYEDYNLACTFVHIRDWPPSGLLKSKDTREIERAIQYEFNTILSLLANHLDDFEKYCPTTFSDGVAEKIKELIKKLNIFKDNLAKDILQEEFAELSEIIILSDEE